MLRIIASVEHAASITFLKGDTVAVSFDGVWWLAAVEKIGSLGGVFVVFADGSKAKITALRSTNTDLIRLVNAPKILNKGLTQNAVDKITLLKRPKLVPPPAAKPKAEKPTPPVKRTLIPKTPVPKPGLRKAGKLVIFDDDEDEPDFTPQKPKLKPKAEKPDPPTTKPKLSPKAPDTPTPPEAPVHKSPPAPKDADGAPHLRLPPLLSARYKAVQYGSKPAQIAFMKSLWAHFNEERFDGKMVMPTIFRHLKEVSADKMRRRAHWRGGSYREIAVSPRLFYADQDYFTEILLHEMCHQAVSELDKYYGREEQGHGAHWKAWMVRVGLDPRRFDPQPNSTYMTLEEKRAHEDRLLELQRNKDATQQVITEMDMKPIPHDDLDTGTFANAVIGGQFVACRLIIQDPKRPQFWLVMTAENVRLQGNPKNRYSFVPEAALYPLKDHASLDTPQWRNAMLSTCYGFILKYYKNNPGPREWRLSRVRDQLGFPKVEAPPKAVPYRNDQIKFGMAVDLIGSDGFPLGRPSRVLINVPYSQGVWYVMEPYQYKMLLKGEDVNFSDLKASELCAVTPTAAALVSTPTWNALVQEQCEKLIDQHYAGQAAHHQRVRMQYDLGLKPPSRIGEFEDVVKVPFQVAADVSMEIADSIFSLLQSYPIARNVYKGWQTINSREGYGFDPATGKVSISSVGLDQRLPTANMLIDQTYNTSFRGGVKGSVARAFAFAVDYAMRRELNAAEQAEWDEALRMLRANNPLPSKLSGDKPRLWFSEQLAAEFVGALVRKDEPLKQLVSEWTNRDFR